MLNKKIVLVIINTSSYYNYKTIRSITQNYFIMDPVCFYMRYDKHDFFLENEPSH